ncbi:uncharacterized protein LOC143890956 [Tasmannia lanceolata]|uniref:uncharacterized protein LOC143890956 n=1 Tax=Tasmannia lanceolata TaxID=3420 RepID=UPI004063B18C
MDSLEGTRVSIKIHSSTMEQMVSYYQVINERELEYQEEVFSYDLFKVIQTRTCLMLVNEMLSCFNFSQQKREYLQDQLVPLCIQHGQKAFKVGRMNLELWFDVEELITVEYREGEETDWDLMESMNFDHRIGFGGVPASRLSIETLGTRIWEGNDSGESCMVCLDEFTVGMKVKSMPCSHMFHEACIVEWLEKSNMCPICRFQMPTSSV